MKIEYLGHACFRIDKSLVIDPYKDGSVPGLPPLRTVGGKVICTHSHADHSGTECVEIDESLPVALELDLVSCWHDDQQGALRGPNTIFIVTSDSGEKLVHLGDLGHFPDDEQLAKISNADYLLIPVGGYYTIDAKAAVKICLAANPKRIIPMHFRTDTSGYPELAKLEKFLELADRAGLRDKIVVMGQDY